MKKVLPPALFIIFVLSMGIICWGFHFNHYIEYPYNLLGLPFIISGLAIAKFNKKLFLSSDINISTFDKPNKLVTAGFFKYSRNPMYLGFVIAILGVATLYQGAISSYILAFLFFILTDLWYIRYEEKTMYQEFGEEYLEYCKNTRRWM